MFSHDCICPQVLTDFDFFYLQASSEAWRAFMFSTFTN